MKNGFIKIVRNTYSQVTKSFAFIPAVVAILFLAFSVFMLKLDFSEIGKHIKSYSSLIRLRDASTARSVVSTILAGIISLTVFSFSNVMILLNQAASQLSNRILQSLIRNRFQQTVLGFYIGTIVYSLFLLSSIRDIDSGIYVPALSIYLLVIFTIIDIFLFIYFLHYVTKTVKFNTVIKNIHKETRKALEKITVKENEDVYINEDIKKHVVVMPESNYFQGFNKKELTEFACTHNAFIEIVHAPASYLLKGTTLLMVYTDNKVNENDLNNVLQLIDLYNDESIETNYYYGFHQLAEVALKALSPGINDPQTAVLSMYALTDLFLYLTHNKLQSSYKDKKGVSRVFVKQRSYEELFVECFNAIWNYGKNDMYVQNAMRSMLKQLKQATGNRYSPSLEKLMKEVQVKTETK